MLKLLTVSIAAYNVEKTIEKCLDSFLPCKHLNELEILVINDGSKDHTAEIVSGYEKRYPGIIYLINKENGGHGSTINKSLSIAKGKFFKVIDGDDWVNAEELDKLVECLTDTTAELVINDYMEVYPDNTYRISLRDGYHIKKVYEFDDLLTDVKHLHNIFAMHSCTILTRRLHDVHMHIVEHCFYADTEYIYFVELAAKTILFDDSCAYQYRLGQAGQSVSAEGTYRHAEDLAKIELDLMRMYMKNRNFLSSEVKKKYLFSIVETRYNMLLGWFINIIRKSDKDHYLIDFLIETHRKYPEIERAIYVEPEYRLVVKLPKVMLPLFRNILPKIKRTPMNSFLKRIKYFIFYNN